mgnify:CR=1 FL=1
MIVLKTVRELSIMKEACRISAGALKLIGTAIEPGVTTAELDRLAEDYIRSQGAVPNFKGYHGYPATACISINNEVIHGIPTAKRKIQAGDIVSVDLGALFEGYHGDNAATFACGDISPEAQRLIDTTRESLYEAIQSFLLLWAVMTLEQAPNPFAFSVGNADRIFEPYREMSGLDRDTTAALLKHFL